MMLKDRLETVLRGLYKIKGVYFKTAIKRRASYKNIEKCDVDFVCTLRKWKNEYELEVFNKEGDYPDNYILSRIVTALKVASIDCDPYYHSGSLMHIREQS